MATVAPRRSAPKRRASGGAIAAIARRTLDDSRVRTIAFAFLFVAVAYIQPVSYRRAYPDAASRLAFAHSFATNKAVVLFYGKAYDLLTVSGYGAWRVGGTLAIFAAIWGLLASVRALRTEEDAGRFELVLAGIASRRNVYLAVMGAIAAGASALWLAEFAGLALGGLAVGGSAYLALATVCVVPVFAGVGAVASQLAPTRRVAIELGGAVVAVSFGLRVVADTSGGLAWLRWTTPLGWAEELRPFTGARPAVLLLSLGAAAALLSIAAWISARRDIGSGVFAVHDRRRPRLRFLSSTTAQTLRGERGSLAVWLCTTGAFAFIVGVISESISSAGISGQLRRELAKLGSDSVVTPKGYLGLAFIFFVLAVSLFAVSQIAAARHEEADGQLETLLGLPVGRAGWLGGRLALAVAAVASISLLTGLLGWVGAASQGVGVSLAQMLEAGANCLPVALVFLGIAGFAYALAPRAGVGIAYGLVAVAFLWQLFGSLLGAPKWLVDLTPFAHVGFVPAQPFRGGAAAIMVASGLLAAFAAVALFRRRDLTAQ